MEDTVLSSFKQALTYARDCYIDFDGVIDRLDKTLEELPEEDTEICAGVSQMLDKAFEMQDAWSPFIEELRGLHLKYRATYIPTEISPEVDELLEVLAKIEMRRRKQNQG
jgi:hypothetical protein